MYTKAVRIKEHKSLENIVHLHIAQGHNTGAQKLHPGARS